MSKGFEKLKKRTGKLFGKSSDLPLLLLIAAVMVLFTGAFNYLVEYVTEKSVVENTVDAWRYAYTDDADYYPAEEDLRLANMLQPLDKKKQGKYLFLTKSIAPADQDRVLKIETDFSPMKIIVNGEDAYNNHFGEYNYVGNAYNALVIPASSKATDVVIFMETPLSVNFEATIKDGTHAAFENDIGLYVGGAIVIFSLIYIIGIMFSSIKKKKNFAWTLKLLPLLLCGVSIFIYKTAFASYYLNDPRFFSVVFVAPAALISLTLLFSYLNVKERKKPLVPLLSVFGVLLSMSSAIFPNLIAARIIISLSWAVNAIISLVLAFEINKDIKRRVQHAEAFFTVTSYIGLISVLLCVIFNLRVNVSYIFISSFAVVVNLAVVYFIALSWERFSENLEEFKKESNLYGDGITEISKFFNKIVNSKDFDDFLCLSMRGLVDLTLSCTGDKEEDLIYCLAEKTPDNQFFELVNHGVEDCNYKLVDHFYGDTGQSCNISDTYFDIVLLLEDDVRIIYHVENISEGTKSFLNSILNTAFFGMEKVYIGFFSSQRTGKKQDVLVSLAERAEKDDGYAPNHLTKVAKIAKALCLNMGLDETVAENVSQAAKLHDIGKIAIPYGIINKKDHLSVEEMEIIKEHADYGYKILAGFKEDFTDMAAMIALDHHERFDGNGYHGKKGEEIDRYARIVTVADVADALLSERPYKAAWSLEAVNDYLNANSGKMFDPEVIAAWNKYYESTLKENDDESEA